MKRRGIPAHLKRLLPGVILNRSEIQCITRAVRAHGPCNLLVFGVGNDSGYWDATNGRRGTRGHTLFVEDNPAWAQWAVRRWPHLNVARVAYGTIRSQWREYLAHPSARRALDVPAVLRERPWDVVLVDAPEGWGDETPGRMQSIDMAARVAAPGADVFVHDCDREVERACVDAFLGTTDLRCEVGRLRHYRLPGSASPASLMDAR